MLEPKILLVRPNFSYVYLSFSHAAKFQVFAPPTGLLFLAAALDAAGVENHVLDAEVEGYSEEQIIDAVKTSRAAVVGFSATTPEINYTLHIAKKIKEEVPAVHITVGGPHAIVLPEQLISEEAVDSVCSGEGEKAFPEFIARFFQRDTAGRAFDNIYYKENGTIMKPRAHVFIDDLDALPFQARYKINPARYTHPAPGKGKVPFAVILSTRGCPYHCSFCCQIMGPKVRYMSPGRVIEEIETIKKDFGIDFIQFNDDTFVANRQRVIDICELLIRKDIRITWFCMVRANLVDDELLRIMRRAGCVRLTMGVETAHQKSLDRINKKTTPDDYVRACALAKKNRIETRASFIIGVPYENKADILATIQFAKTLALDEAAFHIMTPYPGTKILEMAKKNEGIRLLTENFSEFRRWGNAVIELPELSREELIALHRYANRSFHLRPKIIWHHLRRMNIKDTIRAAWNYLPALLRF